MGILWKRTGKRERWTHFRRDIIIEMPRIRRISKLRPKRRTNFMYRLPVDPTEPWMTLAIIQIPPHHRYANDGTHLDHISPINTPLPTIRRESHPTQPLLVHSHSNTNHRRGFTSSYSASRTQTQARINIPKRHPSIESILRFTKKLAHEVDRFR